MKALPRAKLIFSNLLIFSLLGGKPEAFKAPIVCCRSREILTRIFGWDNSFLSLWRHHGLPIQVPLEKTTILLCVRFNATNCTIFSNLLCSVGSPPDRFITPLKFSVLRDKTILLKSLKRRIPCRSGWLPVEHEGQ